MLVRLTLAILLVGVSVGCSNSSSPAAPTPSGSGSNVSIVPGAQTMTTTAYSPNPITVSVGSTVTWKNNDSTTHTSVANAGQWNSGAIAPGATFSTTFNTAGTFAYHCSLHPNMVGTVTVQ